jgi:hypothetical protein
MRGLALASVLDYELKMLRITNGVRSKWIRAACRSTFLNKSSSIWNLVSKAMTPVRKLMVVLARIYFRSMSLRGDTHPMTPKSMSRVCTDIKHQTTIEVSSKILRFAA